VVAADGRSAISLRVAGCDPPALTLFTQLQRYAMDHSSQEFDGVAEGAAGGWRCCIRVLSFISEEKTAPRKAGLTYL